MVKRFAGIGVWLVVGTMIAGALVGAGHAAAYALDSLSLPSSANSTQRLAAAEGTVSASLIDATTRNYWSPYSHKTLPLMVAGSPSGYVIDLKSAQAGQPIDGFGAALTGSAAYELLTLSKSELHDVLENLFNSTTGAGISFVRITIGASDFSSMLYTDEEVPGAFKLSSDDRAVIRVLKMAEQINPSIQVIATPWTAPVWMKQHPSGRSGCLNYSAKGGGSLNPADYSAYAKYFVDFIQAYESNGNGISINYVTPQNEPGNDTCGSPGMLMSWQDENTFVNDHLAQALAADAPSTKILDYDWNFYHAKPSSGSWTESQIKAAINGPPYSRQGNVVGVAWHCYDGGHPQSGLASSGLLNIETECTDTGPNGGPSGTGCNDPTYFECNLTGPSYQITAGLNDGLSSLLYWNLALNPNCGPQTEGGTKCVAKNGGKGCGNCLGVVTVDPSKKTCGSVVCYNAQYYILKALANSIEAGMRWIPAQPQTWSSGQPVANDDPLWSTAAQNADGTTGLYVGNPTEAPQSFWVDENGAGFKNTIPPFSVESFQWTNGCGAPSAYRSSVLASDPTVYYPLSDASGPSACDASGNGNAGTYAPGNVTFGTSGPPGVGTAVTTSSVAQDVVDGPGDTLPQPGSSFTLEAWYKSTSTVNQMLVAVGDPGSSDVVGEEIWNSNSPWSPSCADYCIGIYTNGGHLTFPILGGNPEDGQWYMTDLVYDASTNTFSIYLDGQLLDSPQSAPGPVTLSSGFLRIGWVDAICNQPFDGSLAQVAEYPTALSASTISARYAAAL